MKKFFLINIFLLIFTTIFSQQLVFEKPLSERIANYNISVKLDTTEHSLHGTQILNWKNTSSDKITELQFHLYLNAFKGDSTTFMKESGGRHRGFSKKDKVWGWIDVNSMRIVNGEDLTNKIEFYQPDDSNKHDQTVIRVPLAKPILPGENIELNIDFTSKMPNIFARTGYEKDYYLVGQWFPKIGVYEKAGQRYAEKGQWNCHQFHANSEFYADFGVYNVDITVPSNFVVGATGLLQEEKLNEDGTKYLLYRAEDVIDFAWTASPNFLIAEDSWEHVKIKLMVQPQHFYFANRFLESAITALDYMDKHVGKYPYPNLTIVDPPFNALGSGGMEYPTFITTISFWGLPNGLKINEATTIHEFVHNYFMGLVASNEFEEPWLDEGFTQYFETRIMDDTYGEKSSMIDLFGYHLGDFETVRFGYTNMKNPTVTDNSPFAWNYPLNSYGVMSYNKPATILTTLEKIIGREVMDAVFQKYFERWKFNHPSGKDFINVVNEVVIKNHGDKFGKNMNWFFDQVLYGSGICDFKVSSITNDLIEQSNNKPDNIEKLSEVNDSTKVMYNSEVVIYRNGEVILPIEILIHFENDEEIVETWDAQNRFHIFNYKKPSKIIWAKVDPEFKIKLDLNLENNSLTTRKEVSVINKYAAKVLFWIENLMLTFGMFF